MPQILTVDGATSTYSPSPVLQTLQSGAAAWGEVSGTLADQADLQAALDAKAATSHDHDGTYEPADAAIQAHLASAHAPSNAQKNSDITKAEIEARLTGEISSHSHAGGGQAFPVGSVFIAVVSTDPATLLGYGTWSAFGAGRVLVGLDSGDTAFDTVEETGGSKTVASAGSVSQPTFSGTPFSSVINHTHTVTVTDPGHTHTQQAHTHVITSQTATTGSATSYEHGVLDTSSAEAEATEVTGATTAVNNSATTGITATTANPAGGVASITPAGTVSQPSFTGSATSVVQPYVVVYMHKRVA